MSKLIVAAHQPNFMPNLGFFYKMIRADIFVLITNIQFEREEGWQRRNKLKGSNGDVWLTVPVLGSQNQLIKNVRIDNTKNWQRKHIRTLELNYGKCIDKNLLRKINKLYATKLERLADINIEMIKILKECLGINTKLFVDEEVCGKKQDLLIKICKKYDADSYLSGGGAKSYMTKEYFQDLESNGFEHEFIEYGPSGNEYPYSAVHYILKSGEKEANKILRGEKCVREVLQVTR